MSEISFAGTPGAGDWLFGEAVSQRFRKRSPQNGYRPLPVPRELQGKIAYGEVVIRGFVGGGGKAYGAFEEFSDRYATGAGIDTTHPGYPACALAPGSTTATALSTPFAGVHHVNHETYGLVWGAGDADNGCLWVEDSNAVPAATDYDSGANQSITSMSLITSNNLAKRIVIGRAGAAAQIVTLGTAPFTTSTVANTMDAATTAGLHWMVETPVPFGTGFYVLYQASDDIYIRSTSSIDTLAGTATGFTNVPEGGFALGYFGLRQRPVQKVWTCIPAASVSSASALTYGSERKLYIYWWNADGTDRSILMFNEMPMGVTQAVHVHGGIMATDGERVVFHDGQTETNYGIFDEAFGGASGISLGGFPMPQSVTAASDGYFRCRGFAVNGDDCWALVETILRTSFLRQIQWWKVDWDTGVWHYYGEKVTPADTGTTSITVLAAGSHPFSYNTKTVQVLDASANETWLRQTLPATDENIYFGRNQTSTTKTWATAGFLWTPRWTLPGLAGYPSITESISVTGAIDVATTSVRLYSWPQDGIWDYITITNNIWPSSGAPVASVQFTAADVGRTSQKLWKREFRTNNEWWQDLLIRLDLLGAAAGSPLLTEIRIRVVTILDTDWGLPDGRCKSIQEIWDAGLRP